MTCEELNGMLDRLMDGELSEDERRAMTEHGAGCPDCAEAIRATLQMKALFEEMEPEVDVPLAVQARWRGAVREEAARQKKRRLTRWIGSAAAAVVVLVGVGLAVNGGLSPRNAGPQMKTAEVTEAAEEVMTAGEADAAEYEEAPMVGVIETDGESIPMAAEESAAEVAPMQAEEYAAEAAPMAAEEYAAEAAPMAAEEYAAEAAPMSTNAPLPAEAPAQADEEAEVAVEAEEMAMAGEAEASNDAALQMNDTSCGAVAQQAPAVELSIQCVNVDGTCKIISDLAEDFEGVADVQAVEGGSANVYVELYAREAAGFLEAVAMLDDSETAPELPDVPEEGSLLVLLVVNPMD